MVSAFNFVIGIVLSLFFFFFCYWVFWRFYFLRDPPRKIPPGNNLVSPADGKIISVRKYFFSNPEKMLKVDKGLGKIMTLAGDVAKDVIIVSIFMSPFDVHVNRAPCDGKVISVKHTKGKFYYAKDIKKSIYNEKNEILMETSFGRIKVIQIAGFLARRIESYVRKTQEIVKGQRIGLINLGSQVTLILPAEKLDLHAGIGRKVRAGVSILAGVRK